MANWLKPDIDSQYQTEVLPELHAKDVDSATMFFGAATNIPIHAIRWNRTTNTFQEWDGAAWADLSSGLALGTMAYQNSDNVNITGGTIGGSVNIDASRLTSGTVPTARLGSGSASATTFLAGDQTWKSTPPIGTGALWFTLVPPVGWLLLDGQAVSRVTYAVLFALFGTGYGVGDGSTTFNVPDLRGRFPFGKAVSGTGSTIGTTFGAIDHTHSGGSHTHPISSDGGHTHTVDTHYHIVLDHTHGGTGHNHGINSDGSHQHTGSTGGPSSLVEVAPTGFSTASGSHGHSFTTDGAGSHNHGGSTVGGGDVNTQGIVGGAFWSGANNTAGNPTDTAGAHSHGGATGVSSVGATGSANPPGFVVNFIVKAL